MFRSDGFLAEFIEKTKPKTTKIRSEIKCPECGGINFIWDYDTGETVCEGCGLVTGEHMIEKGPEWRAFTSKENASRCRVGLPTCYSVHDKGLSTVIGRVDRDASGRKLSTLMCQQMWRLKKWQKRSRINTQVEENLARAMAELDRLSDKLYIPRLVREKAAIIYRKSLEKDLIRGKTIVAITAASLYAACRSTQTPRNLQEISEFSSVEWREIARCYRLLLRKLDIQMPLVDTLTYISKIAERTGISGSTQGLAIKIFQEAKRRCVLTGKDPKGLAAAVLYLACRYRNEKKRQQDIAKAAGVSEVTVRNRYKGIERKLTLKTQN